MNSSPEELIAFALLGALAGSLAGALLNRSARGASNLIAGIVGALVGGVLFDTFDFDIGLPAVNLDGNDLAAATVGAALVIAATKLLNGKGKQS